ncbi:MAG TPA: MFS transporter, partial [Polyangiaceae bacterium]|nr:MFS transporter [Polyangiaceae bacterium]
AARLGWQGAFLVLGVLNLLAAGGVWMLLPSSQHFVREQSIASSLRAALVHLRNPRLLAGYVVGFNILFSIVGVFTYVNFHLAAPPFRLGTVALGSIFFVYLAGAIVTPVAGRWLDRLGTRAVLAVAMLLASAGVLLTLISSLAAVLSGLALCAAGIFVCQSAANSYVATSAGRARSGAAGIYVAVYYLGGTVGATAPGFAFRSGGWLGCVTLIVAVQWITAGLALWFWRPPPAALSSVG